MGSTHTCPDASPTGAADGFGREAGSTAVATLAVPAGTLAVALGTVGEPIGVLWMGIGAKPKMEGYKIKTFRSMFYFTKIPVFTHF